MAFWYFKDKIPFNHLLKFYNYYNIIYHSLFSAENRRHITKTLPADNIDEGQLLPEMLPTLRTLWAYYLMLKRLLQGACLAIMQCTAKADASD